MKLFAAIAIALAFSLPASSQQSAPASTPAGKPTVDKKDCATKPGSNLPPCPISKKDHKAAEHQYKQGIRLQEKGRLQEAFDRLKQASDIEPANAGFASARESLRQQLVRDALDAGNKHLLANQRVEAMADFRSALALDPENEFVRQRVRDVLGDSVVPTLQALPDPPGTQPILIEPSPGVRDFHFRGGSREYLEQVANAFGLKVIFDDSVQTRQLRVDITQVDFWRAFTTATQLTKTFYVPLSPRQLLIVFDTPSNRQAFERMTTRTFYVPEAGTPQELNDIVNALRIMFDIRYIVQQPNQGTITMRAPAAAVNAATQFLESLGSGRPEVLFEVKAYEVSSTLTRQVGVSPPLELQVFNVPTEAQKILGNQNIQDIINQLIASGLINQGNTTQIAALIAQFLGQNSSPLLGGTLLLFGGGITQSAIPLPGTTFNLTVNDSTVRTLESLTLRAGHGTPAILKIGSRVPILNATFAPIANSPALSQVLQNQSFQAPFPSFNYEDVGLNIKATPLVRRDSAVTVDLEMQIRALGAVNINGIPVISNREYKGTITVRDGEQIVVAGLLSKSEQYSVRGFPGISRVPIIGAALSNHSKQFQDSELLIVLTPHIIRADEEGRNAEIQIPSSIAR
jgi:general secretion pathway protein D